jgi:cytochrome c-type biogenesis protein CcmH/NrfG
MSGVVLELCRIRPPAWDSLSVERFAAAPHKSIPGRLNAFLGRTAGSALLARVLWLHSRCTYNTEHPVSEQKKTRRQVLEEFVAKKPDDAFSRYGLAMECMNGGDTGAADEHFRELLQRNADYVPAYLMYAQMLSRQARGEEARQVLSTGMLAADRKGDQHARSEMETLLADIG